MGRKKSGKKAIELQKIDDFGRAIGPRNNEITMLLPLIPQFRHTSPDFHFCQYTSNDAFSSIVERDSQTIFGRKSLFDLNIKTNYRPKIRLTYKNLQNTPLSDIR